MNATTTAKDSAMPISPCMAISSTQSRETEINAANPLSGTNRRRGSLLDRIFAPHMAMATRANSEGCSRSGPTTSQDCEPTSARPVPSGVSTAMSSRIAMTISQLLRPRSRSGGVFSAAQKAIRPRMTIANWRTAKDHTLALEANEVAIEELISMTTPRPARKSTMLRIMV